MWLCALCWLVLLGTPSGDAVIIVELPAFNASRVTSNSPTVRDLFATNTGSSIRANRPSSNEPQLMLLVPVSLNDNMGTSRSLVVGEQGRSIMKKAPRQFSNQRQTPVFKKKNKKSRSTGPAPAYTAVCDFDIGAGEDPNVGGRLILTQQTTNDAPVTITGKITNLATGKHGFHIHTFSDFSNQCVSAGGHYDPLVKAHGSPDDSDRHIGDLGNIVAGGDRVAFVDLKDSRVTLGDVTPTKFPIVGRSIVVHEKEDDLGRGSGPDSVIAESKKTGNAGKRLRCCAIRAIGNSDQRTADVILVARSNVKQPLGEFASWAAGKWLPYKTFDVVYQFPDNIFDPQRAVFTAPETGLYSVYFSVWRRPIPGNSEEPWIAVVKNVRDIGSLWRPNLDNAAGVISATGGSLGPQGTLIASGTVPLRRGDILQAVTWGVFRNLPDWFNSDAFEVKLVKKLRDDQIIGS